MNTSRRPLKSTLMEIRKLPSESTSAEIVAVMRDVSMTFDDYFTRALTNISFQFRRGEVFGLLGPAGSGKSTTLRILAGRLRPTEGKVKVFGRSPRSLGMKARIGYLPETASHDRPSDFAGLVDFLKELLFGRVQGEPSQKTENPAQKEQRRRNLKQTVLGNRELIILDEPFSDLDSTGCCEVKDLIQTLTARGKAVVFSSDSLSVAKDICSRIAIYDDGKIQAVGTLGQLLASSDAIRFFGSVLPPATADRVLKVIREEVACDTTFAKTTRSKAEKALQETARKALQDEAPPVMTADKVLMPLTEATRPAAPSESTHSAADPVNHEKLAELTKPANLA